MIPRQSPPRFAISLRSGWLLAALLGLAATAAAESLPMPDIPDPIGLGPRLALIDHLKEQMHVDVPADAPLEELIALYYREKAKHKGDDIDAAAVARQQRIEALRRQLEQDFGMKVPRDASEDDLAAALRRARATADPDGVRTHVAPVGGRPRVHAIPLITVNVTVQAAGGESQTTAKVYHGTAETPFPRDWSLGGSLGDQRQAGVAVEVAGKSVQTTLARRAQSGGAETWFWISADHATPGFPLAVGDAPTLAVPANCVKFRYTHPAAKAGGEAVELGGEFLGFVTTAISGTDYRCARYRFGLGHGLAAITGEVEVGAELPGVFRRLRMSGGERGETRELTVVDLAEDSADPELTIFSQVGMACLPPANWTRLPETGPYEVVRWGLLERDARAPRKLITVEAIPAREQSLFAWAQMMQERSSGELAVSMLAEQQLGGRPALVLSFQPELAMLTTASIYAARYHGCVYAASLWVDRKPAQQPLRDDDFARFVNNWRWADIASPTADLALTPSASRLFNQTLLVRLPAIMRPQPTDDPTQRAEFTLFDYRSFKTAATIKLRLTGREAGMVFEQERDRITERLIATYRPREKLAWVSQRGAHSYLHAGPLDTTVGDQEQPARFALFVLPDNRLLTLEFTWNIADLDEQQAMQRAIDQVLAEVGWP